MSILSVSTPSRSIIYPDSDGEPMAENTLQYDWIVKITGGLRHLFNDEPNVFIAGDLIWYPVEGRVDIRMAPDSMVVFGRPPGHRGSYKQWEEGGIPPQVVFGVLSPGNRLAEMLRKLEFYRRYGVEEYYIYDPDRLQLSGFIRQGEELIEIQEMLGHLSPRLRIRFKMDEQGLRVIRPDRRPFVTFEEVANEASALRDRVVAAETYAVQERARAEQERRRAEQERASREAAERRAADLQAELDRHRGGGLS